MENIPVLYLLFVLLGCALATLAIWSRRRLWIRVGAVIALIALVALNYSALENLLGKPQHLKKTGIDSIQGEASIVLAASIDEGISIYLWLRHEGIRRPVYYRMDWDQEAAIALKKALDRSIRDNSSVLMKHNYESSLEAGQEPLFYALPPQRLPLKPPPEIYEYRNPNNPV